jgi:hypothetical protein
MRNKEMTVCITPMQECMEHKKSRWNKSCYLFSDDTNVEELHKFAESIGLKREWFICHPRLSHYELTSGKRVEAINAGADEVTFKEFLEILQTAVQ